MANFDAIKLAADQNHHLARYQACKERPAFMKENLGTFLAPMVALALVLGRNAGQAALLLNGDFSAGTGSGTPAQWTGSTGTTGVYTPVNPTQYTTSQLNTYGVGNMAYIYNGGTIYQTVVITLVEGQNYDFQLSGVVGQRADYQQGGQPYAELLNGLNGPVIAGNTSDITTPIGGTTHGFGTLENWTIDYSFTAASSGQVTWEVLLGAASPYEMDFANINLQQVPEMENEALALFGFIAVGGIAGRRWLVSRKNALQPVSVRS